MFKVVKKEIDIAGKKLLDYLKRNKVDSYKNVLSKLSLRKQRSKQIEKNETK